MMQAEDRASEAMRRHEKQELETQLAEKKRLEEEEAARQEEEVARKEEENRALAREREESRETLRPGCRVLIVGMDGGPEGECTAVLRDESSGEWLGEFDGQRLSVEPYYIHNLDTQVEEEEELTPEQVQMIEDRKDTILGLFRACDRDQNERLSCEEMLIFSQAMGFPGTMMDWCREWLNMCKENCWDEEVGVSFEQFRTLVDTESNECYCDMDVLDQLLRRLDPAAATARDAAKASRHSTDAAAPPPELLSMSREQRMEMIFHVLTSHSGKTSRLTEYEMYAYARSLGFPNDDVAWAREFNRICAEYHFDKASGIDANGFAYLVNTDTTKKFACNDDEMLTLIPKIKEKQKSVGEGTLFKCVGSSDEIVFKAVSDSESVGSLRPGGLVVAAGPPVDCDGYTMLPVKPTGAVELKLLERLSVSAPRQELIDTVYGALCMESDCECVGDREMDKLVQLLSFREKAEERQLDMPDDEDEEELEEEDFATIVSSPGIHYCCNSQLFMVSTKLPKPKKRDKAKAVHNPEQRRKDMLRDAIARAARHRRRVEAVKKSGDSIETPTWSDLCYACSVGNADDVATILLHDLFSEACLTDMRDCTVLHRAAEKGHADVCYSILACPKFNSVGARQGQFGWTALHLAARGGHEDVVNVLIDHPALQGEGALAADGSTPLHCAAFHGQAGVCILFLDNEKVAKAWLAAVDIYGRTALHCSAEQGHLEASAAILEHSSMTAAIMKIKTKWGATAYSMSKGKVKELFDNAGGVKKKSVRKSVVSRQSMVAPRH